ncbi:MAG: hypothetical protein PHH30_08455, partial [Bacteroidales bacterium]|nr:hypothetical protein [Bacteroidales bacterium]
MNKEIFIHDDLKRDLKDLLSQGKINAALYLSKEMSKALNQPFYFAHHKKPHYPVWNYSAPTVFVHLNPGSGLGDISSPEAFYAQTWQNDMRNKYKSSPEATLNEFTNKYIEDCKSYAKNRFGVLKQRDNFDFKQACFLKDWPESGIDLRDGYSHDIQRFNSINVLDQKLLLELFPYGSNTISTKS